MWVQFLIAMLLSFLLLYVPGYLLALPLSRDWVESVAMAPLATIFMYSLLGIALGEAGVSASWVALVAPTLALGLAFTIMAHRHTVKGGGGKSRFDKERLRKELEVFLPYVVLGTVVCLACFIKPLDGPASFAAKTDNTYHLNLIAHISRTGNWSMLSATIYDNAGNLAAYYPAAWHIIPAMLCQMTGCAPSMASNALNAVLVAATVPATSYYFLRTILAKSNPFALRLGAILPLAFAVYPWQLVMETKYPFLLGMAFVVVAITLFVAVCEGALAKERRREELALLFVAVCACALAHPSMLFSFGLMLVPYIVWVIWRASTAGKEATKARMRGVALSAAFLAFVAAFWLFCYNLPGMESVTSWAFEPYAGVALAVTEAGLLGFKNIPPEILLAIFVWLGVAFSLYRPQYFWLTVGFGINCMQFVLSAISEGRLTHLLTGFWYCDYKRLAAMACVMALPLAALGLEMCARLCQKVFEMLTDPEANRHDRRFSQVWVPLIVAFASFVIVFYPSFKLPGASHKTPTAFGRISKELGDWNSFKKVDYAVLSDDELSFLEDVRDIVGDDAVLNVPGDGSAFAYAEVGLNVCFRRYGPYNNERDVAIRTGLCNISTNDDVREYVDYYDARYILLLDQDPGENSTYFDKFNMGAWNGFLSIDEQTPGFVLVLAEGDMALYEIVDEAA